MTSLCSSYYQLVLAQGVCVGLGAACFWVPSVAVLATYFDTKRNLMTAIAVAGSSIGDCYISHIWKALAYHFDRGYHLSDRIPPPPTDSWLWMGDTRYWSYSTGFVFYQLRRYEASYSAT